MPDEAEATLDEMLKANPDSVQVRLARHRAFVRAKQPAKARAELETAVGGLAPTNTVIRMAAAEEALGRFDTAGARRHLAAIPAAQQDGLPEVRYYRGMVENLEQHADIAVEEWRKGLAATGGTDLDMTWWLARTLIELGRIGEARPLVAQFERLYKRMAPTGWAATSGRCSRSSLRPPRPRDRRTSNGSRIRGPPRSRPRSSSC